MLKSSGVIKNDVLLRLKVEAIWLFGSIYNFCIPHGSLRICVVKAEKKCYLKRTPAMASGLTRHVWSVK